MTEKREETNWDHHYGNAARRLGIRLGLKGNVVLNGVIAHYIRSTARKRGSCLEIGAGSGRLSGALSRDFDESTILDRSAEALSMARRMAPASREIRADIFDFDPEQRWDAVVSVGLAEHFKREIMLRLVDRHLELCVPGGDVYIVVPSYSESRATEVSEPHMVEQYGYQDPEAEYVIGAHLEEKGYDVQAFYMDTLPRGGAGAKLLRGVNLLCWKLTRLNLERLRDRSWGHYRMFHVRKDPEA
ncbi:class I SAM-dependent methyltransferase [Kiritimatiella glycovorans]|uniref:Putative methyltransferase n=1 Tax=Kiritimatiella glycovorans TaxID=1307763 RepID=A0A0G3EGN5_9BACT|nr:class I SAM-dependent methyltransferase [Kiritimatiella glycovorans]AKJ65513.1 putative methyltransferase [Kiritimatiella glycovorans]